MFKMIFPMLLASIGVVIAGIGSSSGVKAITILGAIIGFVALIWTIWIVGNNIGYMLCS